MFMTVQFMRMGGHFLRLAAVVKQVVKPAPAHHAAVRGGLASQRSFLDRADRVFGGELGSWL
jgi:hypothetical protein